MTVDEGVGMFRHTKRLQFEAKPERPDPVYARKLQELVGGAYGEMSVTMQYLFQGWNCRMEGKYKDLLMDTATEEIGHVEMLATMVARLLEGAPATMTAEAVEDPVMAAVLGGMDPLQAIMAGGGALPANCQGVPWNGGYIVASGNLLADFRANAAAEAQGRLQTARLYNMTDDPGVKAMLQFNLARDTVHQKQWLKAIEELEADGLETAIVPNAFFDEEDQVHNRTIWGLSDGTDGPSGGWTEGDDPLEYLLDPEPLGGPGTAPPPDPALFGTYSTVQDVKGTVKATAQAVKKNVSASVTKKATAKKSPAKKSTGKTTTAKKAGAKKASKSARKR
ncbi:manganese catalase family protein [Kribbella sp. ALI-6-A]|uniref:manganese catalase family protein n=1 Tax=Kribbella sp. ALI-6-A TaxID=1933817 RepID=UPI001EDACAE5|nr:manganese catalase family protein [Kribbella sp. ALI-6-A]